VSRQANGASKSLPDLNYGVCRCYYFSDYAGIAELVAAFPQHTSTMPQDEINEEEESANDGGDLRPGGYSCNYPA